MSVAMTDTPQNRENTAKYWPLALRLDNGFDTLEKLAQASNLSRSVISKAENGKKITFKSARLLWLAHNKARKEQGKEPLKMSEIVWPTNEQGKKYWPEELEWAEDTHMK